MSCTHGFVVRDIEGGNRFLCRECNTRFLRYPQKPDRWAITKEVLSVYAEDFIERANKQGFVRAMGVPVQQVTYNFPVLDKATFSYTFIENDDE